MDRQITVPESLTGEFSFTEPAVTLVKVFFDEKVSVKEMRELIEGLGSSYDRDGNWPCQNYLIGLDQGTAILQYAVDGEYGTPQSYAENENVQKFKRRLERNEHVRAACVRFWPDGRTNDDQTEFTHFLVKKEGFPIEKVRGIAGKTVREVGDDWFQTLNP